MLKVPKFQSRLLRGHTLNPVRLKHIKLLWVIWVSSTDCDGVLYSNKHKDQRIPAANSFLHFLAQQKNLSSVYCSI